MEPSKYTSSRLTFADDVKGGGDSTISLREDGMSLLDQLETTMVSASSAGDGAEEVSKRKSKALRTPSFFSRSYIAWKKVYDRGVFTPVSVSCTAEGVNAQV